MDRLENIKHVIEYLMADAHDSRTSFAYPLPFSHRIPATLEERQRMMRALSNVWEPRNISPEFLTMQDAELQLQREEKGVVCIDGEGLQLWHSATARVSTWPRRTVSKASPSAAYQLACSISPTVGPQRLPSRRCGHTPERASRPSCSTYF